jgi:hypothetical protein
MIGSKALARVTQPNILEVDLEVTTETGRKARITMDLDTGMRLADELHRCCWRRPESWGKAPAAETAP